IPGRRDIVLPLAFFAIGFTPITSLALAVFGIVPLHQSATALVLPAAALGIVLALCFPFYGRLAAQGFGLALAAVLLYDATRLPWILTGAWHDFIPNIGALLLDRPEGHRTLGYAWRWLGNGGGMGLAFYMAYPLVARWVGVRTAGLAYGVAVWLCLLGTLVLAPYGQEYLFRLTPVTFIFGLVGHLAFGGALGILMHLTGANVRPYQPDIVERRSAAPDVFGYSIGGATGGGAVLPGAAHVGVIG
ncbi:MAG: hypothetical protein AB7U18_22310, partial [Dehalococcoidia bacterium]